MSPRAPWPVHSRLTCCCASLRFWHGGGVCTRGYSWRIGRTWGPRRVRRDTNRCSSVRVPTIILTQPSRPCPAHAFIVPVHVPSDREDYAGFSPTRATNSLLSANKNWYQELFGKSYLDKSYEETNSFLWTGFSKYIVIIIIILYLL